jgi:dTDP-4-amino-4,6-dideoxygalactose transaminase
MKIPFLDLASLHSEIDAELESVWERAKRSHQFVGGDAVAQFEAEWAAYCNASYCVGVSNGTAALELSLKALGVGPNDEVIIPANTFMATAAAAARIGALPVFVDVDPTTHLITADLVAEALTPRTAAVIVVHLFGSPADMDAINRVAQSAGIAVIEDAAQAHGALWKGRKAGSLSDAGCFSFYPSKNLGAFGDAGAVVTNDAALALRIRSMINHGRAADNPHLHELIGSNDRLDALQAAILSVKLRYLDRWNTARRRAADLYRAAFAGLPIEIVSSPAGAESSQHLMVVMCNDRDWLRKELANDGIATGIHYPIPCHRQPAFHTYSGRSLPVSERAAERLLSLPLFPHITEQQIARVADATRRALAGRHDRIWNVRRDKRKARMPVPSAARPGVIEPVMVQQPLALPEVG